MTRRPRWSEFRAALDAAGFRPSKTLGQNFLLDGNMARSIARDAGVGQGDRVLEVGAGCGFLTEHLAALGCRVLAVEVDRRLFAVASELLGGRDNVRLLRADALAGKHALAPELVEALPANQPWHLVANLPYSISGPLLVLLARLPNRPETMTALVQREVAEKVAARPGDSSWGALSARLALAYERRAGRTVGPALFWPRPRVESRVVKLTAVDGGRPGPEEVAAYDALVEGLFQRRRKTLLASLAALLGDREEAAAALADAGIAPSSRPQELAPAELVRLAATPAWRARVTSRGGGG